MRGVDVVAPAVSAVSSMGCALPISAVAVRSDCVAAAASCGAGGAGSGAGGGRAAGGGGDARVVVSTTSGSHKRSASELGGGVQSAGGACAAALPTRDAQVGPLQPSPARVTSARARSATRPTHYAVARGRITGVFQTWADTEASVRGFKGGKFQGFPNRADAERWLADQTVGSGCSVASEAAAGSSGAPPSAISGAADRDRAALAGVMEEFGAGGAPAPRDAGGSVDALTGGGTAGGVGGPSAGEVVRQ